jgi:DnaK suppressor protein
MNGRYTAVYLVEEEEMVDRYLVTNLEQERNRLAVEIDRLKGETANGGERREGSPFGKREEEADEATNLEKRLVMEKHLTESLGEIDRALSKVESGSYGICDGCGLTIELARLDAMPTASLCLKCKSKQSKGRFTR